MFQAEISSLFKALRAVNTDLFQNYRFVGESQGEIKFRTFFAAVLNVSKISENFEELSKKTQTAYVHSFQSLDSRLDYELLIQAVIDLCPEQSKIKAGLIVTQISQLRQRIIDKMITLEAGRRGDELSTTPKVF
ncbi:MAG: hypothetical protein P1U61_05815 [Legionellaceae bacterium]|nr:hypothetical protein [Legionellaceae bacterium]